MNQLIQQAAEDAFSGEGFSNELRKIVAKRRAEEFEKILSALKQNGYELLRVDKFDTGYLPYEESEKAVNSYTSPCIGYERSWWHDYKYGFVDGFNRGYTLGAARERERMKGVFEKASEDGWEFKPEHKKWIRLESKGYKRTWISKTTDELISIYNNLK